VRNFFHNKAIFSPCQEKNFSFFKGCGKNFDGRIFSIWELGLGIISILELGFWIADLTAFHIYD
jgi:hypothetical protein